MDYQAITRDQPKTGGWVKIFTIKQNNISVIDWHQNNITFKLYQAGGIAMYSEKNIYLSTYKGDGTDNKIQFYDLDDKAGGIECAYIQNGNDIDVYASGSREGVPIKLSVIQCPCIGMIHFYQWSEFDSSIDTTKFVYPDLTNPYYDFDITSTGSIFFKNTEYNLYYETSATRNVVRLKLSLRCINTSCGTTEYLFTIPEKFLPTWQYTNGKTEVDFNCTCGIRKKSGEARTWHEARLLLYNNGKCFVTGLESFSSGGNIDIHIDIEYRRY